MSDQSDISHWDELQSNNKNQEWYLDMEKFDEIFKLIQTDEDKQKHFLNVGNGSSDLSSKLSLVYPSLIFINTDYSQSVIDKFIHMETTLVKYELADALDQDNADQLIKKYGKMDYILDKGTFDALVNHKGKNSVSLDLNDTQSIKDNYEDGLKCVQNSLRMLGQSGSLMIVTYGIPEHRIPIFTFAAHELGIKIDIKQQEQYLYDLCQTVNIRNNITTLNKDIKTTDLIIKTFEQFKDYQKKKGIYEVLKKWRKSKNKVQNDKIPSEYQDKKLGFDIYKVKEGMRVNQCQVYIIKFCQDQ